MLIFPSRDESMIFWTQCGASEVQIETKDVFIVSFTLPAMSDAEFFGEGIVENLAAFLNMDPGKVIVILYVLITCKGGGDRKLNKHNNDNVYVE